MTEYVVDFYSEHDGVRCENRGAGMSEYVFRDAPGYGCDMDELMGGGCETVGEYFASENTDHYGTLHEEIVRCRDCKHHTDHSINLRPHWCRKHGSYRISPNFFCAGGERRADT